MSHVTPQPPPQNPEQGACIQDLVIADLECQHSRLALAIVDDIRERKAQGIAKYGVPLMAENGRDPLVDLYQEVIDGMQYAKQGMEQKDLELHYTYHMVYQELTTLAKVLKGFLQDREVKPPPPAPPVKPLHTGLKI